MRTCPDCQALLADHAKFCDNCGLQLPPAEDDVLPRPEIEEALPPQKGEGSPSSGEAPLSAHPGTCSACGYVNVPGEMFCQNCGVQLAPVVSAPPPPPTPVSTPSPAREDVDIAQVEPSPSLCAHCGYNNSPGETFCQNCGLQLAKLDETIEPSSGRAIPSPPEPAPPSPPQLAEALPEDEDSTFKMGALSGKLVLRDTGVKIQLPSDKRELTIGRTDPVRDVYPDIDLTPHGGEQAGVSRMHARLTIQGLQVYIEDLNSTNFTFLNKQRLQPGQRYDLHPDDEIRFGLLVVQYLVD